MERRIPSSEEFEHAKKCYDSEVFNLSIDSVLLTVIICFEKKIPVPVDSITMSELCYSDLYFYM
jgi:hypothetical protein